MTSGGGETVFVVDAAQLSFVDTGLVNGVAYDYRVAAVDDTGAGLPSASVTATPVAPPVSEQEKFAPRIALELARTSPRNPHYGLVSRRWIAAPLCPVIAPARCFSPEV